MLEDQHVVPLLGRSKRDGRRPQLLVCLRNERIIGVFVVVTNVVRGPLRSAYLGYYAFAGYECQGLMRQGLGAVIAHALTVLKLHRSQHQASEYRADRVGQVVRISKEGYSPRYL
jgi:ribosomal-protein-alanine N-acetyltransferase